MPQTPTFLTRGFWLQSLQHVCLLISVLLFTFYLIQAHERADLQRLSESSEPGEDLRLRLDELTEHDRWLNESLSELNEIILDFNSTTSISQREQCQIAKVSMLYGEINELYERAMVTHQTHSSRQGYIQLVLRNQLAQGYWNKPYYLLALLLSEMSKEPWLRLKWLMWFDADSVILNPSFPVQVFLPPDDLSNVHFLVTKDEGGLNSGIFFVRVHEQSIEILMKSINYPEISPDIDLGFSFDQMALQLTFNESQYHQYIAYMPRPWFNAYAFEPNPGDLLVHFAGLWDRDTRLRLWLERIEGPGAAEWDIDLQQTDYGHRVDKFWKQFREMREFNATVNERYDRSLSPANAKMALENFADVTYYATDDAERMELAKLEVEDTLGLHAL
ncbi:hypothetical protein EDD37DRAFT_201280 [Exophiala viscosa]|uniref:uncharacterized protein n=1 Tax=Exophiala viscosa TaxID=2486360 RepID=UPI0021966935|nr:hypothetical protein EDD37DRAFT_201280 [Exophiala viscosa]